MSKRMTRRELLDYTNDLICKSIDLVAEIDHCGIEEFLKKNKGNKDVKKSKKFKDLVKQYEFTCSVKQKLKDFSILALTNTVDHQNFEEVKSIAKKFGADENFVDTVQVV